MVNIAPQTNQIQSDTSGFLFRKLFYEANDMLLIFDFARDKCIDVNESTLRFGGYTRDEFMLLKRTDFTPRFSKFFPGEDLQKKFMRDHSDKIIRGEAISELGIFRKKDRSEVIAQVDMIPTERRIGEVFITIKDVTDQIIKKTKYEESEKNFQSIVESTSAGITRIDLDGNHVYVSPQIEKFTGYSAEEMLGTPAHKYFKEDGIKKLKNYTKMLLKEEEHVKSIILETIHKGGHSVWLQGTASLIKNKAGIPVAIQTVFIDVSDKILLEQQLEKTKNVYQHIVENIKGVMITTNLKGQTVFASPQIQGILGYTPDEVEGIPGFHLFFEEEHANLEKEAVQLLTRKYDRIQNVYKGKHKDGSTRWVNGTASLTENKDGKPTGFLTVFSDISQEIQLQDKLKTTENRYHSLFNAAIDPIIVRDLSNNKVFDCNSAAMTFFGIPNKSELSKLDKYVKNVTNKDGQSFKEIIEEQKEKIKKGRKSIFKVNYTNQSKDKFIIEINLVIDNSDPEKPKMVFFLKDVTAQVLAYEKIDKERELLSAVLEGTSDQIVVQDKTRKIIAVNSNFENSYKKADGARIEVGTQLAGLNQDNIKMRFGGQNNWDKAINSVLKGKTIKHQYSTHNAGTEVHYSLSASPLKDKLDEVIGIIGVVRDVTELVEKNKEIAEKNTELQKYIDSNIQLENFAYIASHDLKQPLRTIMSFSELLKSKKAEMLDEDSNIYLDFILESSERLNNLINDMLAYSIIGTAGEKESLDPNLIINDVIHDLRAQIDQFDAEVNIGTIPSSISIYKSEFTSLIQNLVSNSIKYSKEKVHPIIDISATEEESNWKFKLQDNGIGIKERYLQKIFGMFQRLKVDKSTTGTGIGLAHCKKILELHNGKIWAESKLNVGTTFYFTIPK